MYIVIIKTFVCSLKEFVIIMSNLNQLPEPKWTQIHPIKEWNLCLLCLHVS